MHRMHPMRAGTQNFLIHLDTILDYIPIFSTISNLVNSVIKKLVLSHKTPGEIEKNRYFKYLKNKDDDWVVLIPFVGNGRFVYHRHFDRSTPKNPSDPKERMLAAIKQDNKAIVSAGSLLDDKDFMGQVVEINGLLLSHAPLRVRQDKEVVRKAVKQNVEALQYAASALLSDKDFMLEIVGMNGLALKYCSYCLSSEIERAAIKQNPEAKKWAHFTHAEERTIEHFKVSPHLLRSIAPAALRNKIVTLVFSNQLAGTGQQHRLYAANYAINNKEQFTDEILKTAACLCINNLQSGAFANIVNDAPLASVTYLFAATDVPKEDLLQAASLILTRYSSHEDLLAIGVTIVNNWLLQADNQESDKLKAIAKAVACYPQDIFSPGVKQKAIEITFWGDNSRFRSNENQYEIEISRALLKKAPEKVLRKLYTNCFIPNPITKQLHLTQLHDLTLERQLEVVDQAGVSRTFLTDLFESLKRQAESDDYKLLKFENIPGGALPAASQHSKEGRYKSIQPHMVRTLTDSELREAADLAYPNRSHHDLNQIRATFDTLQQNIDPLSAEEQKLYMLIGKLMGLCLSSDAQYVIGQIFDPVVYQVMHLIPTDQLNKSYDELHEWTLHTLYEVLTRTLNPSDKRFSHLRIDSPQQLTADLANELLLYAYIDSDERPRALQGNPSLQTVRTHFTQIKQDIKAALLEEAKQHATLKAIFMIAKGVATHFTPDQERWDSLKWSAPETLVAGIQGLFSPELLKDSIQCNNATIKAYFTQWIDEHSGDINKLQDFLYVVTGSRSLAVGSQLKVDKTLVSQEHLPQFHTCFRSIDAYEYSSYALFKQKLETSIQESLASGFQRM